MRARHLPLVEVHGCESWTIVPVGICSINLIFEAGVIGLVASLAFVAVDRSYDAWARESSPAIDLIVVAAGVDFCVPVD